MLSTKEDGQSMLLSEYNINESSLPEEIPRFVVHDSVEGDGLMDVPLELTEQYQKGRVLVFIGQGINGPEWTHVGKTLVNRLGEAKVRGAQTTEEIVELEWSGTVFHAVLHGRGLCAASGVPGCHFQQASQKFSVDANISHVRLSNA